MPKPKKTTKTAVDPKPPKSTELEQPDAPALEVQASEIVVRESPDQPDMSEEQIKSLSIVGGVTTEQLQQALTVQSEQRGLIKKFVQEHLEDGVDFGRIHVVNRDRCPDQDRCKKDYHFSKAVLFKPGQEKLFSLFQITSKLVRDEETYQMLPNVQNLVAYKCIMYRNGEQVGEGRGSAVVGDNRRDANATIKIAEKRARMDACLSLGFSEFFAQDLDDPDYKSQAEMANQRVAAQAEARDQDQFGLYPRDASLPIDNKERAVLYRLTLKAGFEGAEITEMLKLNGIPDPATMTSGQARDMMAKLANNAFAAPKPANPDPILEDVPTSNAEMDNLIAEAADKAARASKEPAIVEPKLEVDDELKNELQSRAGMIGLNARGIMWLMKMISGKPFTKWERLTDDEWRRAYDVITGILDGDVEVKDDYLAGVLPMDLPDPNSRIESERAKQ